MKTTKKTIGIIGGIGPEASANIYLKMIRYCQEHYNAVQDNDYPPAIIYNLPIEGFSENGIEDFKIVENQLIETSQHLEKNGADMILIACNTTYFFADSIQKNLSIPLFNIIEKTAKKVSQFKYKKVGILSSQSTNELELYEKYFSQKDIKTINAKPKQQQILNQVIETVMAGKQGEHETILLKDIIRDFTEQGAQAVVLGCTEIPLAINQIHTDVKLFDTLEIIIQSAVDFSFGKTLS